MHSLSRKRITRMMMILPLVLAVLLGACTPIQPPTPEMQESAGASPLAAPALDQPLPVDPNVRTGTLDNGLTYYIRHNNEPMNRAELWMAINAGSLLEEEDQLGLAHFLEHMLFNGTENFPGMGVVDFLESVGMAFGPDVNAYTSFDETVYTIQVPTDDPETLSTGFQVLEDWAAHATLDPEEVEKERGVIVEEWRLSQETASGRISDIVLPFILGDSRYSDRRPIGDVEIIRNAPPEELREFYETWYRPDLMSIIAVGDFDGEEVNLDWVEGMIQDHFADLPAPADPTPRPTHDVPDHEETRYLVYGDPEETEITFQFIRKRPAAPIQTVGDLRQDLMADFFYSMLNERLAEIAREPDSPFLSAGAGFGGLVGPVDGDFINASLSEESILPGIEAVLTEVERARRHGFTEPELVRAQQDVLRFYESYYNERENTDSASYADDYLTHFLEGEAIPSIEDLYALVQELAPTITLEEINEKAADLVAQDNRVLYIIGPETISPEDEEMPLPGEDALAAVVEAVQESEVEPYVDDFEETPLVENPPAPAEIVAESSLPDVGVTEIELENGVRVLMKPTDFKDDEVVFSGFSYGGSSLVSDEDFPEASTIADIVSESGVGDFSQNELIKLLSGKDLIVYPYIRELAEGIEGATSPADLEMLFQLVYLYFTAPRADESAFEVFRNQERARLANRDQNPDAVLEDALYDALYGDTIRRGTMPLEVINSLDLERGFEIYRERFVDASDFTFIFVGNFDEEELTTLARTYLGNLPSTDREEMWQDVAPDLPQGITETDVYAGEGERSIVQMFFTAPGEVTPQTQLELNAMAGVLDILLREELREELGGAYSAGAYAFTQELPEPGNFTVVYFGTDPGRVDELVEATFEQIEDLRQNGPSEENLNKMKAIERSSLDESLENNAYWLATLKDAIVYQSDEKLALLTDSWYEEIDALTVEDIQAAAQKYLLPDRYVKLVLMPESYEPAE